MKYKFSDKYTFKDKRLFISYETDVYILCSFVGLGVKTFKLNISEL